MRKEVGQQPRPVSPQGGDSVVCCNQANRLGSKTLESKTSSHHRGDPMHQVRLSQPASIFSLVGTLEALFLTARGCGVQLSTLDGLHTFVGQIPG